MKAVSLLLLLCVLAFVPGIARSADVYFYDDADFGGDYEYFSAPGSLGKTRKINDLDTKFWFGKLSVGRNDISSIKVPKGVKVEFYPRRYCQGTPLVLFEGHYRSLGRWNDAIESMKLVTISPNQKFAKFYVDFGDTRSAQHLGVGTYQGDQLLENNEFSMFSCHPEIEVRVWDKENGTGDGILLSSTDAGEGRYLVNLKDFRAHDNISKIQVKKLGYELKRIAYTNRREKSLGVSQLGGKAVAKNASSVAQPVKFTMTRAFTESATKRFDKSVTAGVEVSVMAKGAVKPFGIGAEAEQTVAAKLETNLTWGSETSTSEEKTVSLEAGGANIPPGKSLYYSIVMSPKEVTYDATYYWEQTTGGGKYETNAIVTMKLIGAAEVTIEDGPAVPVTSNGKPVISGAGR